MEYLSERAKLLKPSATMALNRKAKDMKSNGLDVINLTVGEPDFQTPEEIIDYAYKAMKDGYTKYTEEKGLKELREAICEKIEKENKLKYEPEDIVVSNGAKHSLFNIFLAILNPGDEVIIPIPYWVSYPAIVSICGGVPVFCKYNEEFKIDLDDLKEKITKRTKALILNSPSNPTGIVYEKDELERLAEIIVSNRILCISDEVYEKIIFDKEFISIGSLDKEIKDLTILVNGISKTFAMTGWRIGYTASKREIADAIGKIQGQTTSAPSTISQKSSVFAIREGERLFKNMIIEFKRRRDFLIENLTKEIKYPYPFGAFYIFLNFKDMNSNKFAERLLTEKLVAVVPGSEFGVDNYIRISYAVNMKQIKKAVDRINEFVKENQ
ncbi:MAG: pyridoxal phosphate-dependent aminotransferase [Candidatus Omnitrophica bacterium]|nr:pyridoxal phosphate-dependent aminotransferase [Candidatus Omnitrophota bacterium]MCM8802703.1 pyridoxal phosphate-dependent aminotransferase [Candidatus Omnitrophota bacterium]